MSTTEADWRNLHTNWNEKMNYIISNQYACDVALRIREGEKFIDFKAHQFVLNMSSAQFEKMLQETKTRGSDPISKMLVLTLPNANSQIFRQFLGFLYTRKIEMETFPEACEMYKLAKQFNISQLNSICLEFICKNVNITNALEIKEFANTHNIETLGQECSNIIRNNTSEVLKMTKWKLEWIKSLLEEPELNIAEIQLFRLVETWITTYYGNVENTAYRNYLWKTLIHKFCYLNMTADEFLEGPVKTGMISKDESLAIIGHIVSDKKFHLPFPGSFKKTKRKLIGRVVQSSSSAVQVQTIDGRGKNCATETIKESKTHTEAPRLKINMNVNKDGNNSDFEERKQLLNNKNVNLTKIDELLGRKESFVTLLAPKESGLNNPNVGCSINFDLERARNFIQKAMTDESTDPQSDLPSKHTANEQTDYYPKKHAVKILEFQSNFTREQDENAETGETTAAHGKLEIKDVKKDYHHFRPPRSIKVDIASTDLGSIEFKPPTDVLVMKNKSASPKNKHKTQTSEEKDNYYRAHKLTQDEKKRRSRTNSPAKTRK